MLKKIKNLFKRRLKKQKIASREAELISTKLHVAIYESELQNIGDESAAWDTETGGDLFGIWEDIPIIYLATRPGPDAIRDSAHFKLDVNYLIKLSALLENNWGLRYFGDWHSHHKLGLKQPSQGDQDRIIRLAKKNNFIDMIEFIITFSPNYEKNKVIQINSYHYDVSLSNFDNLAIIVLKGLSPVREAFIADNILLEQKWELYKNFPTNLIEVSNKLSEGEMAKAEFSYPALSERVFSRVLSELSSFCGGQVEHHITVFGGIIVIPVNSNQNVAFAFGKEWPHRVLEIDWIDRSCGTREEMEINITGVSLLDINKLRDIFLKAKRLKQ